MPLSTTELLTIVAGSSVVAALVTQGTTVVRDWWKSERDGKFSALYLAIALEDYADKCSSLISDSQNYQNSDGHAGSPRGNLDHMPDFPSAIEWKPLGIKDATKAMSFRVEVASTQSMISGHWEFGDEEDVPPVVREEAARLGMKALDLAIALRKKWGIDPVDYSGEWSVKTFLSTKYDEHVKKRKAWEEANRRSHADMVEAAQIALASESSG